MNKYTCLLILNILIYLNAPSDLNKSFLGMSLLIPLLGSIFFILDNLKIIGKKGIYVRHSFLFIFVFFIVFYQYYIDYLLGFLDGTEERIWVSHSIVCKSCALSNFSLISFFIGYTFQKQKMNHVVEEACLYSIRFPFKKHLCIASYLLFFAFLLIVDKSFFAGDYAAMDFGGFWIIVILQSFFIAMLVLYSIEFKTNNHENVKKFFKYPILIILIYSSIVLLCGRRTEVLRVLSLSLGCIAFLKGEKLNFKKFVISGILLMSLFAIIGVIRGGNGNFSSGVDAINNRASFMPVTLELAGSVNTLHVATCYIPEEVPYNYGLSFFPSFTLLVPGLDRTFNMIFPELALMKSPNIITNLYWGGVGPYGLGSSSVADVYISFGAIGLLVVFFLLGRLMRYLEVKTFVQHSVNPYILALSFCVFSQIIYSMRTGISVLFMSWTYSCMIIYAITKLKK